MPDGKSLIALLHHEGQFGMWEISLDTGVPYRQWRCLPMCTSGTWSLHRAAPGLPAWGGFNSDCLNPRLSSRVTDCRFASWHPSAVPPCSGRATSGTLSDGVAEENGASVLRALDIATGRVTTVANYGAKLELVEPIHDTLQFMATPDGRGFVTTSFERRYDIWMLKLPGLPPATGVVVAVVTLSPRAALRSDRSWPRGGRGARRRTRPRRRASPQRPPA